MDLTQYVNYLPGILRNASEAEGTRTVTACKHDILCLQCNISRSPRWGFTDIRQVNSDKRVETFQ